MFSNGEMPPNKVSRLRRWELSTEAMHFVYKILLRGEGAYIMIVTRKHRLDQLDSIIIIYTRPVVRSPSRKLRRAGCRGCNINIFVAKTRSGLALSQLTRWTAGLSLRIRRFWWLTIFPLSLSKLKTQECAAHAFPCTDFGARLS